MIYNLPQWTIFSPYVNECKELFFWNQITFVSMPIDQHQIIPKIVKFNDEGRKERKTDTLLNYFAGNHLLSNKVIV